MMENVEIGLRVKYRLFLSDFNKTWVFSTDFREIIIEFSEIRPLEAEWTDGRMDGQMDRQTDMTKLIVAFRKFCERA
jgi:hypothetical protein